MNLDQRQAGLISFITSDCGDQPKGIEYSHRLEVYRLGYVARLADALVETYEASSTFFEGAYFTELVASYASSRRFGGFNIASVCDEFHDFVLEQGPLEPKFLSDLMVLEMLSARSFHAGDRESLTRDHFVSLMQNSPDLIELKLQPSVNFVESRWPIDSIYSDAKNQSRDMADLERAKLRTYFEKSVVFLLYRVEWHVRCIRVENEKARFLEILRASPRLVDACSLFESELNDNGLGADHPIHEWVLEWLEMKLFCL